MSDPWNEPLPLMDQTMCNRIVEKTDEYLTLVNWRSNGTPENLDHAIQLAKDGKDGGYDVTMRLRPTSRNFHDWINWSNLITFLVNRDTGIQTLLSAIRNAIKYTRECKYI